MTEWRLVHNDKKVIAIVEGAENGSTKSSYIIEIFDTEKELRQRIDALGLKEMEEE